MSEEVRYIRGNDRPAGLARRPDGVADAGHIRRDFDDADRTYAMGAALLRQAAYMTQVELARRPGITQGAPGRGEQQQPDLLLSILNSYIEAVGARASVLLRFADGHQTELDLSHLT